MNVVWRHRSRAHISIHTTGWARPVGPRMGQACKFPLRATRCEERKPLKGKREKGSPEPENHYKVSRRDVPAVDNPLSIRALLFSCVREIWNPWEKLLGVFKAACLLLNQTLCLDVWNIAFCAVLGVKGKAAEVTWPVKPYEEKANGLLSLLTQIVLENRSDDLCNT